MNQDIVSTKDTANPRSADHFEVHGHEWKSFYTSAFSWRNGIYKNIILVKFHNMYKLHNDTHFHYTALISYWSTALCGCLLFLEDFKNIFTQAHTHSSIQILTQQLTHSDTKSAAQKLLLLPPCANHYLFILIDIWGVTLGVRGLDLECRWNAESCFSLSYRSTCVPVKQACLLSLMI